MVRIIITLIAIAGVLNGLDGLWINLTPAGKLKSFEIEAVENNGIGNSRYINVTGGVLGGGIAYEYDKKKDNVEYIVYPVVSRGKYAAIESGENIEVQLLVKKKANIPLDNMENIQDLDGMIQANVEGVTLAGFRPVKNDIKEMIEAMNLKVSNSVVFMEDGRVPTPLGWNMLNFFGSMLVLMFIFRKFLSRVFFHFRIDLKQLKSLLETYPLGEGHSHEVIKIKTLEDIAPAIIKRMEEYIEEYELYVWLLSEKRSRKLKQHLPQLFEALSKAQCIRNYFRLAHTAATGEENPAPSNWNLQNLSNKALVEKFLELAEKQCHQDVLDEPIFHKDPILDRSFRNEKEASTLLYWLRHETKVYNQEELDNIWSEPVFLNVIEASLPAGLDVLDVWASYGHEQAYQIMINYLEKHEPQNDLLKKWAEIKAKTPSFPIKFGDKTLENDEDVKELLVSTDTDDLSLIVPQLKSHEWLTISSFCSERMADFDALYFWRKYHCKKILADYPSA